MESMHSQIAQKLNDLAVQFALCRKKNSSSFPKEIWIEAIELIKETSVKEVCEATNTQETYMRKKMRHLEKYVKPTRSASKAEEKNEAIEDVPATETKIEIEIDGTKVKFSTPIHALSYVLESIGKSFR